MEVELSLLVRTGLLDSDETPEEQESPPPMIIPPLPTPNNEEDEELLPSPSRQQYSGKEVVEFDLEFELLSVWYSKAAKCLLFWKISVGELKPLSSCSTAGADCVLRMARGL